MAEIQETAERKLARTLRELSAPHAISPEGRGAILPLLPLADLIARAAAEREVAMQEALIAGAKLSAELAHAQDDAATLRRQLAEAHEREERASAEIAGLREQMDALVRAAALVIDGAMPVTLAAPAVLRPPAADAVVTPAGQRLEAAFAEVQAERAASDPGLGDNRPPLVDLLPGEKIEFPRKGRKGK